MAKYAVGDEVILKCYSRLKKEGNLCLEEFCGLRTIIIEIKPDGNYLCECPSFSVIVEENVILGKIGDITIEPGLAIACRNKIQIESISPLLHRFKNGKNFLNDIKGLGSVRIFITYDNLLKYARAVDSPYSYTSYSNQNYNYIEFSDLALKNEIEIRKLNQCNILYNDLAHCYCCEECGRCSIEV